MLTDTNAVQATGLDGFAVKPSECHLQATTDLPVDFVTIDFEGQAHLPPADTLEALANRINIRITVAIRATGFDPLGDDHLYDRLPANAAAVLVAGNPAYLAPTEQSKAIAPRLAAALDRFSNPWVGSEGIERLAVATGAPQFDLLTPTTHRDIEALRTAGFTEDVAVYAPTVPTGNEDEILDAVGAYVARRAPIRRAIPADAATNSAATGETRDRLLRGANEYALVGEVDAIADQVATLKAAGADYVVGYPATGLDSFL